MKRAFDANVSRARPRTRLGRAFAEAAESAEVLEEESLPEDAPAGRAEAAELPAATERHAALSATAHLPPPVPAEADAALAAVRAETQQRIAIRKRAAEADGSLAEELAGALVRPRVGAAVARADRGEALADAAGEAAARLSTTPEWLSSAALPESNGDLDATIGEARATPDHVASGSTEARRPLAAAAAPAPVVAPQASLPTPVAAPAEASRARRAAPGAETVLEGRARIAELRQRLDAAARPAPTAEDVAPSNAAAAVRHAVEELRARLSSAVAERDALSRSLEGARDELGKAQRELSTKARALETVEALAVERARVADELVAEAEALAEERDRALARIAELRSLDEQQGRLLAEAEEALGQRDAALARAAAEAAELTAALDARAAEAEELGARLAERTEERDELLGKNARLEAEVARLHQSREALAEIQRLVQGAF